MEQPFRRDGIPTRRTPPRRVRPSRAPHAGRTRRARPRRVVALASVTALTLAVSTSAGTGHLMAEERTTVAGATAVTRGTPLGPCMIRGPLGTQMSEGIPTPPGYTRSTGVVRALNLMIDFADAPGEGSAMDRFAEFAPQTRKWFRTSSYGRVDYRPEAPLTEWLRMPRPFHSYGIERGAPFEPGYRKLVQDMVRAADPLVDFRTYDLVNVLVTPNAGPSALDTVLSVTFAGNREAPVADGVPVANASFVYSRQDDGSGSYDETGYRVLPHENGHVFGLPDLYTHEGGGAVGHWDIMSEDWGVDNDLLGWHKWKLGWLDKTQVGCAATVGTAAYTLTPLATPGGVKLVVVPLSSRTAYAVELRTRAGNDAAVCRPGILVYKVDAAVDTGNGPIKVYDSRRDSGGCTRSPNVHAELSDAPLVPGESFEDVRAKVEIAVAGAGAGGSHRVVVRRR
ncbi:M6 family metalloprotease domain-containing protein [Streptomyces sp. NPDC012510]|uniref:M6 family metalloprotease domain-containing protein n=1 Tax=Streptomyces sp. NPDC012510 TaxID=3364838 RepID=UPI0036E9E8D5